MKIASNEQRQTVLTFLSAIRSGYEPADYSYQKDDIPTGEYHIVLDFMTWAKRLPAIDFYCSVKQTGQKIRLSVFKDKERKYKIAYLNVASLPFGSTLSVQVELNGNGSPSLSKIAILSPVLAGEAGRST